MIEFECWEPLQSVPCTVDRVVLVSSVNFKAWAVVVERSESPASRLMKALALSCWPPGAWRRTSAVNSSASGNCWG